MLEALITLFLSLIAFPPSQPTQSVVPTTVVEDSETSTLRRTDLDRRGAFEPNGLAVEGPGDSRDLSKD